MHWSVNNKDVKTLIPGRESIYPIKCFCTYIYVIKISREGTQNEPV